MKEEDWFTLLFLLSTPLTLFIVALAMMMFNRWYFKVTDQLWREVWGRVQAI